MAIFFQDLSDDLAGHRAVIEHEDIVGALTLSKIPFVFDVEDLDHAKLVEDALKIEQQEQLSLLDLDDAHHFAAQFFVDTGGRLFDIGPFDAANALGFVYHHADDLTQKLHHDYIFVRFVLGRFDLHPFGKVHYRHHIFAYFGQTVHFGRHTGRAKDVGGFLDHLFDFGHVYAQHPLIYRAVFELFVHAKVDDLQLVGTRFQNFR